MRYLILLALICGSARAGDILIIGDSVSKGYTPFVQNIIPGVIHNGNCPYFYNKFVGSPDNAGNSQRSAACINIWLNSGNYSVVHFNNGLHDVARDNCANGDESHEVSLSDYLNNLQIILDAIRAYGAIPIFATTTPTEGFVMCVANADILKYNAAAIQMMESQGVQIDDLYTAAYPIQGYLHGQMGIHFTPNGYSFLGHQVAKAIQD